MPDACVDLIYDDIPTVGGEPCIWGRMYSALTMHASLFNSSSLCTSGFKYALGYPNEHVFVDKRRIL